MPEAEWLPNFSKYETIENVKNVFQYIACIGVLVYVAVIHSMGWLCVCVCVSSVGACLQKHTKEFDRTF